MIINLGDLVLGDTFWNSEILLDLGDTIFTLKLIQRPRYGTRLRDLTDLFDTW